MVLDTVPYLFDRLLSINHHPGAPNCCRRVPNAIRDYGITLHPCLHRGLKVLIVGEDIVHPPTSSSPLLSLKVGGRYEPDGPVLRNAKCLETTRQKERPLGNDLGVLIQPLEVFEGQIDFLLKTGKFVGNPLVVRAQKPVPRTH